MRGTLATIAWALFMACGCAPTNDARETLPAARVELASGDYPHAIERIDRALASHDLNDAIERELRLTRLEAHACEDTDRARTEFEALARRFPADSELHERALKHVALAHNWHLALEILDHARATDVEFGSELRAIETRIIGLGYAARFPSAAALRIGLVFERKDFRVDAAERHALTRSLKAQGHYALAEYFLRRAIERDGVESEADTALLASLREDDGSRVKEFRNGKEARLRPFDCYGDDYR